MDESDKVAVVAIKGTSNGWIGGGSGTTSRDKFNVSLLILIVNR